jgi:ribosomal protein S18 acetylase RimI-like enzyme
MTQNRGWYDLDSYMNPSLGDGMILLIEKASHKPVGMVAAVINANSTGWISFFIIDEKFRGRGLGRELFRSAEKDLERRGTKMIGLDSVAEQRSTCK